MSKLVHGIGPDRNAQALGFCDLMLLLIQLSRWSFKKGKLTG